MVQIRSLDANVYILKEEEGGRKKPFSSGYRPQAYFRTADVASEITLPANVKIAMPGDNFQVKLRLAFPLPIMSGKEFGFSVVTFLLNRAEVRAERGREDSGRRGRLQDLPRGQG